ncbi:MAG: hypothetical protein ABEK36_04180, partial [Candidatus Aenigmatarchaeota archaeon]
LFNDIKIIKQIHKLNKGGWETGLHGSYYSYKDKEKLNQEKKDLEAVLADKVHGIRQHHLNLDIPETWQYQEKTGLEYDTSLGLKNSIGFRWGTCFPFHPLNPNTKQQLSILELPLIIMDTPLFYGKKDIWPEIQRIINTVE